MSQKSVKTAAELESMITAELREHPECESAGGEVIKPTGVAWDAALVGDGPIAGVLFLVIKGINKLKKEEPATPAEPTP
jgi:hypothetical protein